MSTYKRLGKLGRFAAMALLLILAPTGVVLAASGTAIFVLGEVAVLDENGIERQLRKGGVVDQGDVIVTAAKAHAQLRMEDGGLVSVRPSSRFRIDAFVYRGDKEKDVSAFSLIKGGFRSVTGAIGQANKKAYSVKTPVATIGIRGTDYTARLCSGDCGDVGDGLYVGVLSGGVVLTNDQGSLDIDPNEYGVVSDAFSAPKQLMDPPSKELFVQSSPQDADDNQVATAGDDEPAVVQEISAPEVVAVNDGGNVLEPVADTDATPKGNTVPQQTVAFATNMAALGDRTGVLSQDPNQVVTANDGSVGAFDSSVNGSTARFELDASSTLMESGTDAGTGISWGRWSGGSLSVTEAGTTNVHDLTGEDLHWIAGPAMDGPVALPSQGSVTYTSIGGTTPTGVVNGSPTSGTLTSASLDVDFAAQTVDTNVNISAAGQTWTGTGTGSLAQDATFDGSLGVIIGTDSGTGTFEGALVGAADAATGAPESAVLSYQMDTDPSSFTTTGTMSGVAAMGLAP